MEENRISFRKMGRSHAAPSFDALGNCDIRHDTSAYTHTHTNCSRRRSQQVTWCIICKNSNPTTQFQFHFVSRPARAHRPKPQNLLLCQNKNVIYYLFYCHYANTHTHKHEDSEWGARSAGPMKLRKLPLSC